MLVKDRGKVDSEIDEHELSIFSVEKIQSILKESK
jgi:hypothetical protein